MAKRSTNSSTTVAPAAPEPADPPERAGGRAHLAAAVVLAAVVVALLGAFAAADPPAGLTGSNAPWTDEGFNLANARNRVLFGAFATDDVDRSLTNGAYSALAAAEFAATGPSLVAGRWLSVLATGAAVLALALGLARPAGRRAALLAAAALGGCQLLLQYGRLGFTEPLAVAFLCGAWVLVAGARLSRRPRLLAAGAGVLLALAVSVKAIALVPAAALLGVQLVLALARRDRAGLGRCLAALGAMAGAAALWLVAVALPNLERLRTALRIWPDVTYPHGPGALVARMGTYLRLSDGALPRAAPLLLAALAGAAGLALGWRRLGAGRRELALTAAAWAGLTWVAVAAADYAPNRYVVPALPGLAVLAGLGLDTLTARVARGRALVAAALAVAVALPGTLAFAGQAAGAGRELATDQRELARLVGPGAVVYGAYGPTLLFATRARLVTPWAPAGANVRDPAGRFGVTHVITDGADQAMTLVPVGLAPAATVRWGPHLLRLYALPGAG